MVSDLSRRELTSIVDNDMDSYSKPGYDGIIQSYRPASRWDLGFIESKADKVSSEGDRVKLINVLKRHSILSLRLFAMILLCPKQLSLESSVMVCNMLYL